MKLTIDRAKFLKAFSLAASATGKIANRPASQSVLLRSENGAVSLFATDLEIELEVLLADQSVDGYGHELLSAKFGEALRASCDESLTIATNESTVSLTGVNTDYTFPVESVSAFPHPTETEASDKIVTVDSKDLLRAFRGIVFAAAKESTRFALNGVHLETNRKTLVFCATDAKRLAIEQVEHAIRENAIDVTGVIIPLKTVGLLQKLLVGPDEAIKIEVRPNAIAFHSPTWKLSSRLVEGRFPPYKDIRPKPAQVLVANAGEFLSACRQVAVVTDEESRRAELCFYGGAVVIKTKAMAGQAEAIVSLIGPEATRFETALDPHYLIAGLSVLSADDAVEIMLPPKPSQPVTLVSGSWSYLVMPLA